MSLFKRYIKIKYHLIGIFLALFILLFPAKETHAAGFTHVHTDACYGPQTVLCTNHHVKDSIGYPVYHCSTCNAQRNFVEIIYWDHCDNSGINGYPTYQPRDVAYIQYCMVCGAYRRCEQPDASYSHYVTINTLCCGKDTSTEAASVSLSASTTAWTKDPVTLSVGTSVSDSGFSFAGAPYDFGSGATSDPNFTVSANGTYSVTVFAADGRSTTESITVSNIDLTSPSVSLSKNTEDWSESGITVIVTASDGESGLADEPYSYNGGAYTSSPEFRVTANGDVRVCVKDSVGNITEQTISVTKVGRDPAVVAAEREAAERAAAEKAAAERAAEQARIERENAERAAAEQARIEKENATREATKKASGSSKKDGGSKKSSKKSDASSAGAQSGDKERDETKDEPAAGMINGEGTGGSGAEGSSSSASDISAAETKGNLTDAESPETDGISSVAGVAMSVSSADEVSDNIGISDESGNIGAATDLTDIFGEDTAKEAGAGLTAVLMSVGNLPIYFGLLMLVLSAVFFSFFNYVYVSADGRKRPVALAKIKYDKSKVTIMIKKEALGTHGKYLVYLSPWVKLMAGNRPVYGSFGDSKTLPFPLEGGRAFTY